MRRREFQSLREALAIIGTVNSGIPSERTFFGIPSVGDTAMTDDVATKSRKALARVNAISERTIFWGMIFTVLVAIAVMTRGVVG